MYVISDEVVWDVEVRQDGERTILYARGELDLDTAPRLLAEVERRLAGGARGIVIDLGALTFIDSTGLGTLVGCWRRAERTNATFQLVNPTPDVAMTLEITGLDRILPVASG
jgi:anti-anti-sigma factor